MSKSRSNVYCLVIALTGSLVISGCAKPVPELQAAAASLTTTPLFIEGDVLKECTEKSDLAQLPLAQPKAIYQPGITYEFAHLTHYKGGPSVAKRMRIYLAEFTGKGLFGNPTNPKVLCVMALDGSRLSYLQNMWLDSDGGASYSTRDRMIDRLVAMEPGRRTF